MLQLPMNHDERHAYDVRTVHGAARGSALGQVTTHVRDALFATGRSILRGVRFKV